jgi:ribosomal protein S27E
MSRMYHTDPPPEFAEFLFGPIPRDKTLFVVCPRCGGETVTWSPATGVLVCPVCNARLLKKLSRRLVLSKSRQP